MPERRTNVRKIAIIAHVDHSKTTLVDAMLRLCQVSACATAMLQPRLTNALDASLIGDV